MIISGAPQKGSGADSQLLESSTGMVEFNYILLIGRVHQPPQTFLRRGQKKSRIPHQSSIIEAKYLR